MLGRRAEVTLDSPRALRTVLDAGIVAGAGGGIEKTLLAGARFHEGAGYRSVLAFVHPASDRGFEKLRSRGAALRVELHDRAETFPFSPLTVAWFARLCREHGVDIWHAHDYKTDLIGLLLQPLLGFSLVSTLHGWSEDTRRTRLYFALDRRVIRRYEQVIAVSSELHAEARRLGVSSERLSLIENGVDGEEYRCSGGPRGNAGALHIGAAGRLTPEKGFLELIAAVEALLEEGHDIRLSIAGDGPQRGALEERIRASRHTTRLALVGFIDDMRTLYAELDLFCLSSLREGLPNVVLEAMAMSLPVVATTVGGLSTFLRDGDDALLCAPGSPAALADALRTAIASTELRFRLGQAARARVERECSFALRMRRVFAVYDRLS